MIINIIRSKRNSFSEQQERLFIKKTTTHTDCYLRVA